jgi:hypothetical protein
MGDGEANQGRAIGHEVAILDCRWMQVNDTGKTDCYIWRLRKQTFASEAPLCCAEVVPRLGNAALKSHQ